MAQLVQALVSTGTIIPQLTSDLDVKEIVNLWSGGSAVVKSILGRHWNECARVRDDLACRHADPGWLREFAESGGLSIPETGPAGAGMSPVAGQARGRSASNA